jgi:hypothetical protein
VQDLDYDAAIPLYIMRPYMVEFLHSLVHGGDHSNILEDFLYITFRSIEYIAMTRANAIMDLLIARPMRWLAGSAYRLDNFSPVDMCTALGLVHDLLVRASADGSVLLDADIDVFKPITETQLLFAEWREHFYEKDHALSPDGSTPHLIFALARDEVFNPQAHAPAHICCRRTPPPRRDPASPPTHVYCLLSVLWHVLCANPLRSAVPRVRMRPISGREPRLSSTSRCKPRRALRRSSTQSSR